MAGGARPGNWTCAPARSTRQSGKPGGEYPFWVTVKGNSTAYVSSIRDREIVVVDIFGTPRVTDRIKVTGQPLKMTLNASETTLYVAEEQTDSVAVINTITNQVIEEADVPRQPACWALPPRFVATIPIASR